LNAKAAFDKEFQAAFDKEFQASNPNLISAISQLVGGLLTDSYYYFYLETKNPSVLFMCQTLELQVDNAVI
jgi:hypothetical protein